MTLPDSIWAALIIVSGSVILAPLANRLLTRIFEHRASLRVVMRLSEYRQPEFLSAEIERQLEEEIRSSEKFDPDNPKRALRRMASMETLAELKFTNGSKRKIDGITVMIDYGSGFHQLENNKEMKAFERDTKIEVGDLQPRHDTTLYIWLNRRVAGEAWVDARKLFLVSANEIDKVHFRYPAPAYLARMFTLIPRWVSRTWWVSVWAIVVIGLQVARILLERSATH